MGAGNERKRLAIEQAVDIAIVPVGDLGRGQARTGGESQQVECQPVGEKLEPVLPRRGPLRRIGDMMSRIGPSGIMADHGARNSRQRCGHRRAVGSPTTVEHQHQAGSGAPVLVAALRIHCHRNRRPSARGVVLAAIG